MDSYIKDSLNFFLEQQDEILMKNKLASLKFIITQLKTNSYFLGIEIKSIMEILRR